MIRQTVIACVVAGPLAAQGMTPDTCRIGWQAFSQMVEAEPRLLTVEPDVTDKGWCRVDDTNADLIASEFTALLFRGAGIEAAIENNGAPQSLEVRIDGIDLVGGLKLGIDPAFGGQRARLDLDYAYDPGTRALELKALELETGGLGHVKIKASGGGVDITALEQMQLTWGGARLTDLSVQVQTTPMFSPAFMTEQSIALMDMVVRALPDENIDPQSRAALLRFIEAGPGATGLLNVSGTSEQGLGLLQVVAGTVPLADQPLTPETLGPALEIVLRGVTVNAEWIGVE